jgi:WD40 repeat protein
MAILWDVKTSKQLHRLAGHTSSVEAVAFSPDGRQVLTGSKDKRVTFWDSGTGKRLLSFSSPSAVYSAAFNPDGQTVMTGSGERAAILWDARTGKQVRSFQGYVRSVNSVILGSDGRKALVGTGDKQLVVWDLATGVLERSFHGPTSRGEAVALSGDGQMVLAGSKDNAVVLLDARTGKHLHCFREHTAFVQATAFSPDGRKVVTGSHDRTVILWDAVSGKKIRMLDARSPVRSVSFAPDGQKVLIGSDKAAILWDSATGEQIYSTAMDRGGSFSLPFIAVGPDGKQMLIGSGGLVWLCDVATGKRLRSFRGQRLRDFEADLVCGAFSRDGRQVVFGSGFDKNAVVCDVATGKTLRVFQHLSGVNTAVFTPDGRKIVTGSDDGAVRLWDIKTGDELCHLITLDEGQEWAVVTPEGLFDGSKAGREKVFFQDFYYPGLLAEIWRGRRPLPGKALPSNSPPLVKILVAADKAAGKGQVHIDVAVSDQGGGIKGPFLKHNRVALSAPRLLPGNGRTRRYRFTVSLVTGDNRIEVRAATSDGARESEPAVVTLPFTGTLPEPELHLLAVGIGRYNRGIAQLPFAASDARAIANVFRKRAQSLYKRVHVTLLLDEEATRAGILRAIAQVSERARPQDTLVVFVSGHGHLVKQRYYLVPQDFKKRSTTEDVQEDDVRAQGLPIDELGDALALVPALKRVLIFDTCHSGAAVKVAEKGNNPFAFRGAIERFHRAQGVYCLAGSAESEKAWECEPLGHGVLTYTLLAGLNAVEKGDLKGTVIPTAAGDHRVNVLDWLQFARRNVSPLYERYASRRQHVELRGEDQPNFPLLSLKEN